VVLLVVVVVMVPAVAMSVAAMMPAAAAAAIAALVNEVAAWEHELWQWSSTRVIKLLWSLKGLLYRQQVLVAAACRAAGDAARVKVAQLLDLRTARG